MSEPPPGAGERLWALEPRLRLLLMHLAGPAVRARVEVDDLIQEVFVRALASQDRWPPPSPNDGALYGLCATIARHCTVDVVRALRARKREARTEPLVRSAWSVAGVHESALAAPGPGPGTRAGEADEMRRITRAFESLAPDHRRVLGLRQFEGLDAEAAGRRMGRSAAAVHSLYRRALAAWEAASG